MFDPEGGGPTSKTEFSISEDLLCSLLHYFVFFLNQHVHTEGTVTSYGYRKLLLTEQKTF